MTKGRKKPDSKELAKFKRQWEPVMKRFFASTEGKRLVNQIWRKVLDRVERKTGYKV